MGIVGYNPKHYGVCSKNGLQIHSMLLLFTVEGTAVLFSNKKKEDYQYILNKKFILMKQSCYYWKYEIRV